MKLDGADAPVPVHVDGVPLVGTPGHVHEASGGVNVRVGSNVRLARARGDRLGSCTRLHTPL